ncbi:MAG: Gfo/Idh/MocA family protein [Caldilineaceae bacterium]
MTKTIRWGIIGVGDVTEVKSGPALQKAQNSELVAVMRRNADKAKDYAQRHSVPKWYDDADALIADPDVDVVYIATPPYAHKPYTVAVAAAGKPVYVEKPMALNYDECEEMVGACRAASVPLWVAYYRRALPRFLRVRQLLEANAIGEVRFVNVRLTQQPPMEYFSSATLPWRVQPEIAGGGLFVDLASHTLDVLDYLLSPIARAAGHATNQAAMYEAEDIVSASWVHESGVHGLGVWCFTCGEKQDKIEFVGTSGSITLSCFGTEPVLLHHGDNVTQYAEETPQHIQLPLIQTIVDELNGSGHCPSTGESGARTTRVMDAILHDYYHGD